MPELHAHRHSARSLQRRQYVLQERDAAALTVRSFLQVDFPAILNCGYKTISASAAYATERAECRRLPVLRSRRHTVRRHAGDRMPAEQLSSSYGGERPRDTATTADVSRAIVFWCSIWLLQCSVSPPPVCSHPPYFSTHSVLGSRRSSKADDYTKSRPTAPPVQSRSR